LNDDPLTFQLATNQVNRIRHLVSLKNLLVLTSGAEFQVTGGDGPLTPSSVLVKTEGYRGASPVEPLVIGETVLFVQEKGERVRDFAYRYESDAWTGADLTLAARHLFERKRITSWDYAQNPFGLVWVVREDGALLSLTYLREHGVTAWARHDTAHGFFESVAVVPEEGEDGVYFAVRREIGGRTVRLIERLSPRLFDTPEEAFFVDCGTTWSGAPVTKLTGLDHLEGMEVALLADGDSHPRRTVVDGSVTLGHPASRVHAGLPLTADLAALPLTLNGEGLGRVKKVTKVTVRVEASRGLLAGPAFDELTELKQRSSEPWGAPITPMTGEVELLTTGGWSPTGAICLRQAEPLPLIVQALIPEVTQGG